MFGLDASIRIPTVVDTAHIIDGFRTTHIAILYHGVVIILRLLKSQYERFHVVPTLRIATVATRQRHCITDVETAAIVCCQYKLDALRTVTDIGKRLVQLFCSGL